MRRVALVATLLGLSLILLGAKHRAPRPASKTGPRRPPAIELERWINSPRLRPADLKNRVRVVEFWAFDCVNCRNTLPAMRELHARYATKGVVVLGIHTPEFPRERDPNAVAAAVRQQGIRYPVALDNDRKVWDAFHNRYWPALYLLDRDGVVRATHIGELHLDTRAWRNFCAAIDSAQVAGESRRARRS